MIKEFFWAWGLKALAGAAGLLGADARLIFARWTGRWISRLFPRKRRDVVRNLAVINAWSGGAFTIGPVFENFAGVLADFLCGVRPAVQVEGVERAEQARRQGRGVVFLTGHLGHWELGGRLLAEWGWRASAVYHPYRSRAMQRFIQARRAPGMRYLPVGGGAMRGASEALRKGETVAFVGDRPFGELGEKVRLCGRTARMPRGPFLLAARHGSPIVPGFVLREGPSRYKLVMQEPIWPEGRGIAAARGLLEKAAAVLEKVLARHGDQWFCFEPVWEEN